MGWPAEGRNQPCARPLGQFSRELGNPCATALGLAPSGVRSIGGRAFRPPVAPCGTTVHNEHGKETGHERDGDRGDDGRGDRRGLRPRSGEQYSGSTCAVASESGSRRALSWRPGGSRSRDRREAGSLVRGRPRERRRSRLRESGSPDRAGGIDERGGHGGVGAGLCAAVAKGATDVKWHQLARRTTTRGRPIRSKARRTSEPQLVGSAVRVRRYTRGHRGPGPRAAAGRLSG